nr:PI-PLC X domain-containing protein At5g67130 [Tanacetum cinerariifolium]
MVENQYGDGGMKAGECPNRGESSPLNDTSKSLVLVNYFRTLPLKVLACGQNSGGLLNMTKTCYSESGNRWANFLAVDFYKRSEGGGTFQAVDLLNGERLCGCNDVHSCVPGGGSWMAKKPKPNGETQNLKFLGWGEACLSGYEAENVNFVEHCARKSAPIKSPTGIEACLGEHLAPMKRPDKIPIGDWSGFGALPHPGQGILRPPPAIYASQATTLPSAFSAMPLQDPTWHMDIGLHLYMPSTISLVGDTDADWVGYPSTRSAEAEYRGVANVVAEIAWLRNLLHLSEANAFTMKMKILLEPTSNKLLVEHLSEANAFIMKMEILLEPISNKLLDHIKMELEITCTSKVKFITEYSDTAYTCYELMKDQIKVSKFPDDVGTEVVYRLHPGMN